MPDSAVKRAFTAFIKHIQLLSLGEWEELHTHTLDLNPSVAPYIGFQIWGESYKRGHFMALLNRVFRENNINPCGELPDHLIPVLRYLGSTDQPVPELIEILTPAVQKMQSALRKKESNNAYTHLLEAVLQFTHSQGGDIS